MKWLVRNRMAVGLVVAALAITSLAGTSMAGERHYRGHGRTVVIGSPTYIYASPAVVYAAPAPVVVYPAPVVVYQTYPAFHFRTRHWGFGFGW